MTPSELQAEIVRRAQDIAKKSSSISVDQWAAEIEQLAQQIPSLAPTYTDHRSGTERRSVDRADGVTMPSRRHGLQRRGRISSSFPASPILTDFGFSSAAPVTLEPGQDYDANAGGDDFETWVPSETQDRGTVTYLYSSVLADGSDGSAVMTVNSTTGVCHAVANGTAYIDALAVEFNLHRQQVLTVVVQAAPIPTALVLSANGVTVQLPGTTGGVNVSVRDQTGNVMPALAASCTWASSETNKATCPAGPAASTTVSPVATGGSPQLTVTLDRTAYSLPALTASIPITVLAAPTSQALYSCVLSSANYPGYDVPPTAHLGQAPYTSPNFIKTTMLADQSGAGSTYEVVPHNPLSASGTQATEQWYQFPERTPLVQPQAAAPNGYALRIHYDLNAGNQQRGLTVTIPGGHLTTTVQTWYRLPVGFNLEAATAGAEIKWHRHRAGGLGFFRFGCNNHLGIMRFWGVWDRNGEDLNLKRPNLGSSSLWTPIRDGAFHRTDTQVEVQSATQMRVRMWHDTVLILDYTLPIVMGQPSGLNRFQIHDTLNSSPIQAWDFYILPPRITADFEP